MIRTVANECVGRRGVPSPFYMARLPYQEPVARHDLGPMDQTCARCQALHWKCEEIRHPDLGLGYGSCCDHGMVRLPPLPAPPPALQALFDGSDPCSRHFKDNIRQYNAALAFTSLGVQVDDNINRRPGPYVFRIHGELCHYAGSLLPDHGRSKSYAQLYIVDTAEALNLRTSRNRNLDAGVMQKLQDILISHHQYAEHYRHAYEVLADQPESDDVFVRLAVDVHQDPRTYNMPTADEVAVILPGDGTQAHDPRDIRVYKRDGRLWRMSDGHPAYACLHYVLLFPHGTHGWHYNLRLFDDERLEAQAQRNRRRLARQPSDSDDPEDNNVENGRRLSQTRFYAYQMFPRANSRSPILHAGRLFQQYLVDMWASAEQNRLRFVSQNQEKLRAHLYSGIMDQVNQHDEVDLHSLGQRSILPSSYTGSPRYMAQLYQDALAIGRAHGKIDLFITVTANPTWPEITRELQPGERVEDRPELTTRVFSQKKKSILDDIIKHGIFGRTAAHIYTIEFQKRGLPHMHLLIFLDGEDKIRNPSDVDECISAYWPDPDTQPLLFDTIQRCMVHGPCGALNPQAACMANGQCSKGFPKPFEEHTSMEDEGYPKYRRPDDGRQYCVGRHDVDNRWIVPYNPFLSAKYDCHINVETSVSFGSLKYVTKYIHKGPDCATVEIFQGDEISKFLDSRYVSSCEAAFRIFHFELHRHYPSITRLPVSCRSLLSVLELC
jgi:hypothetical protein